MGVCAEPELTKRELTHKDKLVAIASDGVWEFLTNQTVVDMIGKFDEPLDACRAIVAESYRLWLQCAACPAACPPPPHGHPRHRARRSGL